MNSHEFKGIEYWIIVDPIIYILKYVEGWIFRPCHLGGKRTHVPTNGPLVLPYCLHV